MRMAGHNRQDIEISLDLIEELTSHRISPFKVASPSNVDILVVHHDNMATARLPSLPTTPRDSFMSLSHPYAKDGRLTSRSQFKNFQDTRVPNSVLRGYVFGGGGQTCNRASVGNDTDNVLHRRGQRSHKDKDKIQRSRSECTLRRNDIRIKQSTPRILHLDSKRQEGLPKIPRESCLVHNAGTECTCAKRSNRSHSNASAAQGVCQLRDRLRFAASRLSNHDMFNNTEREKVRSEVIQGLTQKTAKKGKNITSNERACKFMKGSYALVKSFPPKERTSSRNYINIWLDAGAETPRFLKEETHEDKISG